MTALGTANVYGSGARTTAVNIWMIKPQGSSVVLGYLIKAFNGTFWYEPPVPGVGYQQVSVAAMAMIERQHLTIEGCFTGDLPARFIE